MEWMDSRTGCRRARFSNERQNGVDALEFAGDDRGFYRPLEFRDQHRLF